jgi:hypothetical protein
VLRISPPIWPRCRLIWDNGDCACSIFLGVDVKIAILDEPNHGEIPWEAKGR